MNKAIIPNDWFEYAELFSHQAVKAQHGDEYREKCLNYAEHLYKQGLPIIFDAKHFSHLVGYELDYIFAATNDKNKFYRDFSIAKRNGKERIISEPLPNLKEIQRWILDNILSKVPIHPAAKGYVKGQSIVDNAKFHRNQEIVLKIDIKDFFPSIKTKYINACFKRLGYSQSVSKLLTEIVTYKKSLPQGAPTSPTLSNMVMYKLDRRILKYAQDRKIRYTRYADDITLSGSFNTAEVIAFTKMVITETGFKINEQKTRTLRQSSRQIVTGIVVNEKLQTPKERRHELRQELYYIKRYGLDSHMNFCKIQKANYIDHLRGKAHFILQVNSHDKCARELLNILKEDDVD